MPLCGAVAIDSDEAGRVSRSRVRRLFQLVAGRDTRKPIGVHAGPYALSHNPFNHLDYEDVFCVLTFVPTSSTDI
jgi:hypothetical protein